MSVYANTTGRSGVRSYTEGPTWIVVTFASGDSYEYTVSSAGASAVAMMKKLARAGAGLNTFITRNARKLYSRKL